MKKIFVIDWFLIPLFILSASSGVGLHIVCHRDNHELWHNWAVCHVVASLLFLIGVIFHILTHWNWYKAIINKGVGKKSKVTLWLSVTFLLLVVTGIVLLIVDGANSPIGLWHYKTGVVVSVLSLGHLLKRISVFGKSLPRKNAQHR